MMSKRVQIPIRVRPAFTSESAPLAGMPDVVEAVPPLMERESLVREPVSPVSMPPETHYTSRFTQELEPKGADEKTSIRSQHLSQGRRSRDGAQSGAPQGADEEDLGMWRDRAQRLQAEMENFRKRQQRLADERIAADRERLLRAFLDVADNLERALNTNGTDVESIRQGVGLTHQTMERLLDQEGAELIQAKGQPFDPTWHEAVSTVPYQDADAEPDTVIEVVQAGYRLGDRLLRPARVIVAT
jgi:molecular chaperone GrpE